MKKIRKRMKIHIAGILYIGIMCSCGKVDKVSVEQDVMPKKVITELSTEDMTTTNNEIEFQKEKGYDLPVSEEEKVEAEQECKELMNIIKETYYLADKGNASNVVISDKTLLEMQKMIGEGGYAIIGSEIYSNMLNYEQVEKFLKNAEAEKSDFVRIYEIQSDGGIGRRKYIFDGNDMYVVSAKYSWNNQNEAVVSYINHTRIDKWKYSEKGWFCYKLCVPEYPNVTEVVDGSCLIRVKPIKREYRDLSEKYVLGLAYKGNNVLCSNWDANHLEKLDYNGMYEYLYHIKYNEKIKPENYSNGIPKEEFENLITEFIPVSVSQVREYAAFDDKYQTYIWTQLGCFNYAPNLFGNSFPEVTNIKEKENGIITLTVEAVNEMILYDETVFTHELEIHVSSDGGFQYLGNRILDNGMEYIPDYQYRIDR